MSEQDNIRVVRRMIDDLNLHDPKSSDALVADNILYEFSGSTRPLNKDQGRLFTLSYMDAFPDIHFNIRDVIAQGNKVAVSWLASGTHRGLLNSPDGSMAILPTFKKTTFAGIIVFTFADELVSKQEIYWDMSSLLMQLGLRMEHVVASI